MVPSGGAFAQSGTSTRSTSAETYENYNLPSGALAGTLRAISRTSGRTVRFEASEVAGETAPAVTGRWTAVGAVQAAISESGLTMTTAPDGAIVVFVPEVEDVIVVARRDQAETSYRVNAATTSSRTGETLRDIAQGTSVISGKLLEDQQITTIADALANSGVVINRANTQGPVGFNVRGFAAQALTNGIRNPSGSAAPLANVERIEVLKGPSAILAGAEGLGGSVNIVTKRPSAEPLMLITASLGSYDDRSLTFDASNAINADRTFSARLIASTAEADHNAGGYRGRDEWLVNPTVRYKTAATDITLGVALSETFSPLPAYTLLNPQTGEPFERRNAPIGPMDQGLTLENSRYYYDASHRLTPWLTVVARGESYSIDMITQSFSPLAATGADGSAFYQIYSNKQDTTGFAADTYARMNFNTWSVEHTLIVGHNYTDYTDHAFAATGGSMLPYNVFDYDRTITIPAFTYAPSHDLTYERQGVYLQDLIEFGRFHVNAAVRRNWQTISSENFIRPSTSRETATSTVPSFGVVYDLTDSLSVYANYLEGFNPTSSLDRNGDRLGDNQTTNIELGLKADVLEDRLSIIASLYRLEQSNLLQVDNDPGVVPGRYRTVGGVESQGFELDVTGQLAPGLNIKANYAFADYAYQNPTDFNREVAAQPRHRYSIWAAYERPDGRFKGWGGALGVFGQSESFVTSNPSIRPPTGDPFIPTTDGGVQVDGALFIPIGRARLNLGVKNIFDEHYYRTSYSNAFVPIAEPRTYTATLTYRVF